MDYYKDMGGNSPPKRSTVVTSTPVKTGRKASERSEIEQKLKVPIDDRNADDTITSQNSIGTGDSRQKISKAFVVFSKKLSEDASDTASDLIVSREHGNGPSHQNGLSQTAVMLERSPQKTLQTRVTTALPQHLEGDNWSKKSLENVGTASGFDTSNKPEPTMEPHAMFSRSTSSFQHLRPETDAQSSKPRRFSAEHSVNRTVQDTTTQWYQNMNANLPPSLRRQLLQERFKVLTEKTDKLKVKDQELKQKFEYLKKQRKLLDSPESPWVKPVLRNFNETSLSKKPSIQRCFFRRSARKSLGRSSRRPGRPLYERPAISSAHSGRYSWSYHSFKKRIEQENDFHRAHEENYSDEENQPIELGSEAERDMELDDFYYDDPKEVSCEMDESPPLKLSDLTIESPCKCGNCELDLRTKCHTLSTISSNYSSVQSSPKQSVPEGMSIMSYSPSKPADNRYKITFDSDSRLSPRRLSKRKFSSTIDRISSGQIRAEKTPRKDVFVNRTLSSETASLFEVATSHSASDHTPAMSLQKWSRRKSNDHNMSLSITSSPKKTVSRRRTAKSRLFTFRNPNAVSPLKECPSIEDQVHVTKSKKKSSSKINRFFTKLLKGKKVERMADSTGSAMSSDLSPASQAEFIEDPGQYSEFHVQCGDDECKITSFTGVKDGRKASKETLQLLEAQTVERHTNDNFKSFPEEIIIDRSPMQAAASSAKKSQTLSLDNIIFDTSFNDDVFLDDKFTESLPSSKVGTREDILSNTAVRIKRRSLGPPIKAWGSHSSSSSGTSPTLSPKKEAETASNKGKSVLRRPRLSLGGLSRKKTPVTVFNNL